MTGQVRFTTMAIAMNVAFERCKSEGRNPGRVGHRVLTANAKGIGRVIVQRDKPKETKEQKTADSAVVSEPMPEIKGIAYVDGKATMIDREPVIKYKPAKRGRPIAEVH